MYNRCNIIAIHVIRLLLITVWLGGGKVQAQQAGKTKSKSQRGIISKPLPDTLQVKNLLAMAEEYHTAKQYDRARSLSNAAILLAQKNSYAWGVAAGKQQMGAIWYAQKECNFAESYTNEAIKEWQSMDSVQRVAQSLNMLGLIYEVAKKNLKAVEAHEAAIKMEQQVGITNLSAQSQTALGNLKYQLKQYEESRAHFKQALAIAEEKGDKGEIALVLYNMGKFYGRFEADREDAVKHLFKSAALYSEKGDKVQQAASLLAAGQWQIDLGRPNEGFVNMKQALSIVQSTGAKNLIAEYNRLLAEKYYRMPEYAEGLKYGHEAVRIYRSLSDTCNVTSSYLTIATILMFHEKYDEALPYYQQVVAPGIGCSFERYIIAYSNIGGTTLRLGHYEEAVKIYTSVITQLKQRGIFNANILNHKRMIANIRGIQGRFREQENILFDILKEPRLQNNIQFIRQSYNEICDLYVTKRQYDSALLALDSSLIIFQRHFSKTYPPDYYLKKGAIYYAKGFHKEALGYLDSSALLARKSSDKIFLAGHLMRLGELFVAFGDYANAQKYLLETIAISSEGFTRRETTGQAQEALGEIYRIRKDFDEALKHYMAALGISKEIGDKSKLCKTYGIFADVYAEMGNDQESLNYRKLELEQAELLDNKQYAQQAKIGLASLIAKQGRLDEAYQMVTEALRYFETSGNYLAITSPLIEQGSLLAYDASINKGPNSQSKLQKAIDSYKRVFDLYDDDYPMAPKLSKSLNQKLSEAYELLGDHKTALHYYKRYVAISDSLMNDETIRKLAQQRMNYEVEKAARDEKIKQEQLLATQKARQEEMLLEQKAKQDLELASERLRREKMIALEKIRYEHALAMERISRQKMLELKKLESEGALADAVIRNNQALQQERSKQALKQAEMTAQLQKEKAARRSKTEASFAGLVILAMVTGLSLFAIKKYNEQQRAMEKAITAHEMAEMELQSLRAQLNPHFMFNSLNAIQDLILHEENEKSQLYLKRFSSLLRILLDNASQPFVSLRQELELQKLYLSLEQLRIPNLQYNIEIDPALNLDERMTPNMILQPYLENAVWHGLSNKKGDRKLTLRIMNRNGGTLLQIEDNGIGRKQAAEIKSRYKLGHKSKGMQLLSKRFELLSQEYGAQIKSTITDLEQDGIASGTLVTIELPVSLSEGVIDASINPKNADTYARIAVG